MLYYRLYKRMKRNFYFNSPTSRSLDYVTFLLIIPIAVGVFVSNLFYAHVWTNDEVASVIILLPVGIAAVYIHLCEKRDKEP
jgi:hypothetical protein